MDKPLNNRYMDFKDSIRQISERIENLKDNLQTEEATKTALNLSDKGTFPLVICENEDFV